MAATPTVVPLPIDSLTPLLAAVPEFRSLLDSVRKRHETILLEGLTAGAPGFVLTALLKNTRRPTLWIVPDQGRANRVLAAVEAWWPDVQAAMLPALEVLPYEIMADDGGGIQRLGALGKLARAELDLLVTPAAALLRRTMPARHFADLTLQLRPGLQFDLDAVAVRLIELGYVRTDPVERMGEFAIRGGLLDVYAAGDDHPLRIEWWGDEIESCRRFDIVSQRTIAEVDQAVIGPARDIALTEVIRQRIASALRSEIREMRSRLGKQSAEAAERLEQQFAKQLAGLETGLPFAGMEWLVPYAYEHGATVIDLLPKDALCIIDDPLRVDDALAQQHQAQQQQFGDYLAAGRLLPGQVDVYMAPEYVQERLRQRQRLYVQPLARNVPDLQPRAVVAFPGRAVPSFRAQWQLLAEEITAWQKGRRRILLGVADTDRAARLAELLKGYGTEPLVTNLTTMPNPGQALVAPLPVVEGFELPAAGLVVLTETEIADRPARRRRRAGSGDDAARIRDPGELQPGDYIVHVSHGIGRYLGLQTKAVQDTRRDYLVLQYQGGDRLYVPTDQIGQVQRYIGGGEGREPRLSRLGTAEWSRAKERVRRSVQQMAEQLLELYAARQAARGYAFSPDGPWQREFEAAFPHTETEDQLRAIEEIKRDMESRRPMDRLLCGDVGYGKTEVAMRAAFKAIVDGKQVAVLVPTTVLAQQHYRTFCERFSNTPAKIELLSRFRSAAEQQRLITDLRRGTIDIVIGTHRLAQGDVGFKDLGLLIIDEEHRFGVAVKERLKQLKHNVDVLSMTATPIPRTLHMALAGLRDMSVIETPPEDRQPVQTYVLEHNPALIRDAISREMSRGGQVYYVHNRINSIPIVAKQLRELVPEARIAIAHGQMSEDELETIMVDFQAGAYDVLLSTTIIESGLDIGNVNTLIAEDADRLGLAQLYQLRGRVGRSHRVAYAYLTYRPGRTLTEVAEQRLTAIRDFTEFGAGFKLAMRDMEIRGAGNILGPEQHGFIASVGFDLYAQLLEEAVRELRGERAEPKLRPSIDLRWDAYIPDDYIRDPRLKVEFYKRIERAGDRDALAQLRDEMIDRFGELPEPVWNLLITADVQRMAAGLGVVSITQTETQLVVELVVMPPGLLEQVVAAGERRQRRLDKQGPRPVIYVKLADNSRDTLRKALNALLGDLRRAHRRLSGNGSMKGQSSVKY